MTQDYDYVTLYLPFNGPIARCKNSQLISDEAIEWLNENVGTGTMSGIQWLVGAEERQYEWCYAGMTHSPESHYTQIARVFYIRDADKATMFKLAWGGK